jgi:transcriptional regulator with XRE-family HTH domain
MKQVELAKQLGISKSYLSMILSGQRKASPEMARKLSSLKVVNFKARFCLEGRNSTTELLPQK